MNKKFRFFTFFFTLVFFSLSGLASQEKDRDCPIAIKILPLNKDFLVLNDKIQSSFSEALGRSIEAIKSLPESQQRYLDEHGYGTFFEYTDAHLKDHHEIASLKKYREENLNNSNPMVVNLLLYSPESKTPTVVRAGFFISGEENYQLTKKGGTEPVNMQNLLCSEVFTLKLDYKIEGFLKNDALETTSSKSFKSIIKKRESFTSETNTVAEAWKSSKEFRELEIKIKEDIRNKIETKMLEELKEYTSPFETFFGVPSLEGMFPFTLASLYKINNNDSMVEEHFNAVVKRIFDLNLGAANKHKPLPSNFISPGITKFNMFLRHIIKDEGAEKFCLNLFGRNPLDSNGQDGCFQSAFRYYFTDSEQAFLKWLDGFESSTAVESNVTKTQINKIDVVFLSYFDMCPACRGTMSYLLTKTDGGQGQPWLQRRILNFLQGNEKREYNIKEDVNFDMFCVSLAKCNKGEQS